MAVQIPIWALERAKAEQQALLPKKMSIPQIIASKFGNPPGALAQNIS